MRQEARSLVDEARARDLRLASAPSMFMSEASQTAWKALREGTIGTVRLIYAEVNWGRIETWHPAPESFYDIGVMMDVGIYPLSLLTAIVGPARRVWAYGTVLKPDRVTKRGVPFTIHTPELIVAMVEFASGPVLRLTTNWYVETPHSTQASGVEFHGDDGSLVLSNWLDGDASIKLALRSGKGWEEIPLVRPCEHSVVWSRAVSEMARAIAEHRLHRADGNHGAHLVDILCSIDESIASGGPVDVRSTFTPPEPMEWAQ
jgi:predicted dehydrogenase